MVISSLETLKKISKNYLEADLKDGSLTFRRFTEKQLKAYNLNDALRIRSLCPAGVCFDFYTDSGFVKLKYLVKGKSRDWMYFDIYIDNVFTGSEGQNPVLEPEGELFCTIPGEKGRMSRVTIYLPHLVEIEIKAVELSDNARVEEAETGERCFLCAGDSITQGMSALYPSSSYPVQLARYFGASLLNHGVGGYIFNKESLDEELGYIPDVITIAYGTNDWNRYKTTEEFSQRVKEYMDKLTEIYPETNIFVITPIWRSDVAEAKTMGEFKCLGEIIGSICSAYARVEVIDGLTLVPNMPHYYGDATVHPSDEGFLHYSIGLIRRIEKYFKEL